jgi:hypothetical protein
MLSMFFIVSCGSKPDDKRIQENVTKHLQLNKIMQLLLQWMKA